MEILYGSNKNKKEKKKEFIAWLNAEIERQEALKLSSKDIYHECIAKSTFQRVLEKFKEIY